MATKPTDGEESSMIFLVQRNPRIWYEDSGEKNATVSENTAILKLNALILHLALVRLKGDP